MRSSSRKSFFVALTGRLLLKIVPTGMPCRFFPQCETGRSAFSCSPLPSRDQSGRSKSDRPRASCGQPSKLAPAPRLKCGSWARRFSSFETGSRMRRVEREKKAITSPLSARPEPSAPSCCGSWNGAHFPSRNCCLWRHSVPRGRRFRFAGNRHSRKGNFPRRPLKTSTLRSSAPAATSRGVTRRSRARLARL